MCCLETSPTVNLDMDMTWLLDDWYPKFIAEREEKRREILFRKFSIRKCSNHRKYKPIPNYKEMTFFVPHRKIHKAIQKLDRKHQALTDTHPKQTLKLARLEKKYASLLMKLRKLTGL